MMKTALPDRLAASLGAAMIMLATSAHGELAARVAIASGYLHRGLEQTQSSPAYQASVEYQAAGWFGGVWASSVDFDDYDQRSLEVDYYLGYGRRLSPRLALEAVAIHYTFRGNSPRDDNWSELQVSAYAGDRWTITGGIADNWWATDERTHFVEGTFRYPLPARLILDTTLGYQLADRAAEVSYGYAEAGVSRRLHDVVLRVGYSAVESDARDRFLHFAGDHWIASVTWQI